MEKQFNDFAYQVFADRMFAIPDARLGWDAGVKAERERIKEIIKAIGVQGEHDQWFDACDKIMEKIDDSN